MNNDRQYRYVSLDGCKMIGEGKHGRVYLLNDEQIVKTYYDETALDQIELERRNGRRAFVLGVPSCITFDTVKTDQGYGIIFELASGKPLGSYISEHPDELEPCAIKYADVISALHAAKADPAEFDSAKQFYIDSYRMTPEKYFSQRDADTLIRIIEAIPDRDGLIHNDLHTQNVMIDGKKELMLIDMAEITRGHPIFDLGCIYMTMVFSPKLNGKLGKSITGLSGKNSRKVWDHMLRRYFRTADQKKLAEVERLCRYMRNMRLATLISRTSVFPAIAYRICAWWTKFFVIAHAEKYIRAFQGMDAVFADAHTDSKE